MLYEVITATVGSGVLGKPGHSDSNRNGQHHAVAALAANPKGAAFRVASQIRRAEPPAHEIL